MQPHASPLQHASLLVILQWHPTPSAGTGRSATRTDRARLLLSVQSLAAHAHGHRTHLSGRQTSPAQPLRVLCGSANASTPRGQQILLTRLYAKLALRLPLKLET